MNNKAVMLGSAVLAFLVAAVLVIMIFKMLFGGRLRMPGGRARQARLGIVDAFDLDRQRQLIIVRRDNTEHLIMIGGPNDLVIESEIIRAEARDIRDVRREPALAGNTADGRIPAPLPALEKNEPAMAAVERAVSRPVEAQAPPPPPPMPPVAVEPRRDAGLEPVRAPTFPLPPRRPSPPPERRPPPPPLPASVTRGDEVPAHSGQPAALVPAPTTPTLPKDTPPPAAAPLLPAAAGPAPAASPAAASPRRPPFLKPLSSRPPIRPLQRTTPQPPAVPPAPVAPVPSPPPPPPQASAPAAAPVPPPRPAPPPTVAAPPAPANSDGDSKDALESLEEEMAKLLGRGG